MSIRAGNGSYTRSDSDLRFVRSVGNFVDVGQFVPARDRWGSGSNGPGVSGSMALTYFYADHTETISTMTAITGATAAGATPTLCRMGIYTVAANGDITLVASTPNDTTLFAAANTAYPKGLSSSYGLIQGALYTTALIVVSGATIPLFHGVQYPSTAPMNTVARVSPAFIGRVTGQTDLPASVAVGSITGLQTQIGIQLS